MKLTEFLILFAFVCCFSQNLWASLRDDLEDRPFRTVVIKSQKLAKNLGPTTGALVCGIQGISGAELCTGTLLDPWTVLTAAHSNNLAFLSPNSRGHRVVFKLDDNCYTSEENCFFSSTISNPPIIHPKFHRNEKNMLVYVYEDKEENIYISDILVGECENMTLKEFSLTKRSKIQDFYGVDLAIFKLDTPAPEGLSYPEIMGIRDLIEENTNGICIGYGNLNRNNQENGPIPLPSCNYYKPGNKALFSSKISPEKYDGENIFYGCYKARLGNGNESFIPTEDMMKTAGLPTSGSSGGPFLIKSSDGIYKLAGVMSRTLALYHEEVEDPEMREKLTPYIVPIFPVWVDSRSYEDWILKNMGPTDSLGSRFVRGVI